MDSLRQGLVTLLLLSQSWCGLIRLVSRFRGCGESVPLGSKGTDKPGRRVVVKQVDWKGLTIIYCEQNNFNSDLNTKLETP